MLSVFRASVFSPASSMWNTDQIFSLCSHLRRVFFFFFLVSVFASLSRFLCWPFSFAVICQSSDVAVGQTDRQTGEAGLAVREGTGGVGGCEGAAFWGGGGSITAFPGLGSRCKAPTVPQPLSLLCDIPLQSCPLPRQLQQETKEEETSEKKGADRP